MNSDASARERALDVSASFAVQAPAGSGKTELLMQRFLKLLSIVEKPEQILALTFTRKAAGQMHSRIIAAIGKAAQGFEADKPHERKTIELAAAALERDAVMGWRLLENPGRLKVQTIDSFSSTLARQMPLLSGLGSYTVTEEPLEFYLAAAEATVALVEDDGAGGEAVRRALAHMDNSVKGLTERLVMMLGRRDQWLRHVTRSSTDRELKAMLEGSLKRLVESELESIEAAFPPPAVSSLLRCARFAASNINKDKSAILNLASIARMPTKKAEELPLWKGIAELLLTKEGGLRKPGGVKATNGFPSGDAGDRSVKDEFKGLLSSLEGDDRLVDALGRARKLPSPVFDEEEWETLLALVRLLPIADGKLNEAFTQSGSVDFQAIALAALRSLGTADEPTDLMLSLDLRIQHILVDEYQDTSQTQLALLEALTRGWTAGDGRTLFVVGDPMQSIYLFREAEVGLFLEARLKGIGTVGLTPLTLSRNFRSQEKIVSWVNGTLSGAFPDREETFTGSVTYAPSTAVKEAIDGRGVEIRLLAKDDLFEAGQVLSILENIPSGETAAVLCRSRSHVDSIVGALTREGIPFRARDIDPLFDRTVIQDLLALLKALDHPFDRVAWLACLRAPWCGLGLGDLFNLCYLDKASPVMELMRDERRLSAIPEDGRVRLERFREGMEEAREVWGRRPPSEVLRGLWIAIGGPACVDGSGMRDAEEFLGLVGSIEEPGGVSIEGLEARTFRLFAGGGVEDAAVDIMTIHKAKGLEFDNVIIPGLGKKPRHEERRLLVWMEKEDDLLLAPVEKKGSKDGGDIYNYLFDIHKKKAVLEETRLLYVAATRAKKSLYLIGHVDEKEDGTLSMAPRSFLSQIKHALNKEMLLDGQDGGERSEPGRAGRRLGASWALPEAAPPVIVESAERLIEGEPEFYWAGEAIRHLGTVVHRYFCRIAREGVSSWDRLRLRGEQGRIARMLRSLGLGKAEAAGYAAEGVKTIVKALEDEKGRWILSEHDEAATELPLTAVLGGEIVHIVIDRTFVDSGGVRWVIDYKTGTHEGGSLEEFLASERERYRGQLEKYALALAIGGEKREIRKGLYYPAHRAWVEVS